jgi:quercetin dioxygenase-like cupin family protein
MKLEHIPFQTIEWATMETTTTTGETGVSSARTVEVGTARVRIVEYSPGYRADHWCERGHVLHVLAGELETELRDGRRFVLRAGDTYIVGEHDGAHRSESARGATLFIVD